MAIILAILLVLAITVALFYRSKAKEFESLFELSKSYEDSAQKAVNFAYNLKMDAYKYGFTGTDTSQPKLNKDGSIAKKRGRKSNVKTT